MKSILFISISAYTLEEADLHLAKKFEGLSGSAHIFLIGRGKFLHKHFWNCDFYLVPARILYVPWAILFGSWLCVCKKVDALVCQGPLTEGLIGIVLKFLFHKELIIEIHGDWQEGPFLNRKRLFAPFLKKMVPLIANFSFARADKIRGVAEYFLRDLRKKYPNKKYFVFPTYSDLDIFLQEERVSFQKYISTVAVLSPIKNIETLIEAFAKLSSKFSNFQLVIAGDGSSREKLQATSYKLQVTDRVVFTGKVSPEAVKNIMKDCFVFVLPSLSEGLPRVLLEAMALAKPVIASNVGGIPEVVRNGENGFLIEQKDVSALTTKLEYLLNHPEAAKRMGEAGQSLVRKKFSNEQYIAKYIQMINV